MYEKIVYYYFLWLNGIAKIKNAKIKMLRFGVQIAKISNRRKYTLYGIQVIYQSTISGFIYEVNSHTRC